jgi:hypothetical protein
VRSRHRYLILGLGLTAVPLGVVTASPAAADCTFAGGVSICAQGDVRGADGASTSSGPYVPYPCDYDWYCDGGDLDIILDPGPPSPPVPPIDIGRPGRPGGPR